MQTPWALNGAPTCTANVSPAAPDGLLSGDEWVNVAAGWFVLQTGTTSQARTFVGSAWMAKSSGTGPATLLVGALNNASSCACGTSDGSACIATVAASLYCQAVFPSVGTRWFRGWVSGTFVTATTAPLLLFAPGEYSVSTGTTRLWGAAVSVGTIPGPYSPTTTTVALASARPWR